MACLLSLDCDGNTKHDPSGRTGIHPSDIVLGLPTAPEDRALVLSVDDHRRTTGRRPEGGLSTTSSTKLSTRTDVL
jgi:hypothetical protein